MNVSSAELTMLLKYAVGAETICATTATSDLKVGVGPVRQRRKTMNNTTAPVIVPVKPAEPDSSPNIPDYVPDHPPAPPYIPNPEKLNPERLCPNQKERVTRTIEDV